MDLNTIHDNNPGIEHDKDFVYNIFELIFGELLKDHTVNGTRKKVDGILVYERKLDENLFAYGRELYNIRVRATAINAEERKARLERATFAKYIRLLSDLHHKKKTDKTSVKGRTVKKQ